MVSGSAALDGVRVIDLTQYIAGPYCTKLMADYGADVIKIERPGGGDPARKLGPFRDDEPHLEGSGLFLHLNTNKRSLSLNLKSEAGRKVLLELVKDADILVESYAPRVMPSLGLDYAAIESVNPRIVMASLSNFGQTGPYRDYKLSEITLYAIGGTMHSTGENGREPVKLGMTVEQFFCGMMASAAVMGGLMGAKLNGIGQYLDLSMYEFMAGHQDRAFTGLTIYELTGEIPQRVGPEGASSFSPVYPVSDGFVQFFAIQRVWDRVCLMIDQPELIDLPEFANIHTPDGRRAVDAVLAPWLMHRHKQDVMELAQSFGLFCGAMNTTEDAFKDPHLADRRFLVEADHPYAGRLTYPGAPFLMSEAPRRIGRAPLLGEHTKEILEGELGYAPEDVARFRQQGVV